MATKTFCDCCGKEAKVVHYQFRVHMKDIVNGHVNGFVDNDMNRVSGRDVTVELCHKCYNEVVYPSVAKLKELNPTFFKKEL